MFGKEMHNLKKPDKQVKQKQMWRLTLIPDLLIIPRRVQTRLCSVLFMCYEYSECMQHSFFMYASEKGRNSGCIHGCACQRRGGNLACWQALLVFVLLQDRTS